MKNKIFIALLMSLMTFVGYSQSISDQNPNYKASQDKYMKSIDSKKAYKFNVLAEGTTSQETYAAIDPMEAKRKKKELRKYYRSQRPLWRHQRRMERAKHPVRYRNYGYNYGYRGGRNNWLNYDSLLNLGMLGYYLFD